ncbi:MAG: hypothetical protein KDA78_21425, partial [Planctomycetaceae bacterium]|nr:hypothetical protein [Planctomycetaceae bacterium]
MPAFNWIQSVKNRIFSPSVNRRRSSRSQICEQAVTLEQRVMLSANAIFDQVHHRLTVTGSDSIEIDSNAAGQVRVNNTLVNNGQGSLDANDVQEIVVKGSNRADTIDLRQVQPGTFQSITSVEVHGNGGDDLIYGSGYGDVIYGNDGDDVISGGAGNDRIYGNEGNDRIGGGIGDDIIHGSSGDDLVSGGSGNDRVTGENGQDDVRGGGGNDSLDGGAGDDVLNGDDGNDIEHGGEGNDIVSGGEGNDRLFGDDVDPSTGSDSLAG